jgi:hypothetical protein
MAGAAEPELTACRIRAQLSEFCGQWCQSRLFSAGPIERSTRPITCRPPAPMPGEQNEIQERAARSRLTGIKAITQDNVDRYLAATD